jgi:hypothetical protein
MPGADFGYKIVLLQISGPATETILNEVGYGLRYKQYLRKNFARGDSGG